MPPMHQTRTVAATRASAVHQGHQMSLILSRTAALPRRGQRHSQRGLLEASGCDGGTLGTESWTTRDGRRRLWFRGRRVRYQGRHRRQRRVALATAGRSAQVPASGHRCCQGIGSMAESLDRTTGPLRTAIWRISTTGTRKIVASKRALVACRPDVDAARASGDSSFSTTRSRNCRRFGASAAACMSVHHRSRRSPHPASHTASSKRACWLLPGHASSAADSAAAEAEALQSCSEG